MSMDLRVKKTRRALMTAMMTILGTTPFPRITVNDLCVEAMVSRSAFYAHFQDKYDLARQTLQLVGIALFEQGAGLSIRQKISVLLTRISQDARLFKNLIIAEYDQELMALLRQGFLQMFHDMRDDDAPPLPPPEDIALMYYASGLTGAITKWLNGSLAYTVDEMSDCLCALLPASYMEREQAEMGVTSK